MTTPFLTLVARDLVAKCRQAGAGSVSDELRRTLVVLPSRRAGLFLSDALRQAAGAPVWTPRYCSIDELFRQLAPLSQASRRPPLVPSEPRLVCELYRCYVEQTHSSETLDSFYFWGQVLLRDFQDIDRNMADARALLQNLQELRRLDSQNFLSQEQRTALSKFFAEFRQGKASEVKRNFAAVWDHLGDIYTSLRTRLRAKGLAYSSMLSREVAESLSLHEGADQTLRRISEKRIAVVGFNVLSPAEKCLLDALRGSGRALFYFDYCRRYVRQPDHEAGTFARENLARYGNELPPDLFEEPFQVRHIEVVSASTSTAQARYVGHWLQTHPLTSAPAGVGAGLRADAREKQEREQAVVLCDESLLLPVLHSLPPAVRESGPSRSQGVSSARRTASGDGATRTGTASGDGAMPGEEEAKAAPRQANVTMGFPMRQTPAYSFVDALLSLHTAGARRTGSVGVGAGAGSGDDGCLWRYRQVATLLRHPYTARLLPEHRTAALLHQLCAQRCFMPSTTQLSELEQGSSTPLGLFQPRRTGAELLTHVLEVLHRACARRTASVGMATGGGDGAASGEEQAEAEQSFNFHGESIFRAAQVVSEMLDLVHEGFLSDMSLPLLRRLVLSAIAGEKVPFHGEPAEGLQVMGVLETRCLDFQDVLLLSVGERQMPKAPACETSFIPYALRHAFGLSTIEREVSVYAYYFYRLLQRARSITLCYNSTPSSTGGGTGEPSRFVMQLMTESGLRIEKTELTAPLGATGTAGVDEATTGGEDTYAVAKTPEMLEKLRSKFVVSPDHPAEECKILSPSALNTFIDCPLSYYFHYVLEVDVSEELGEDIEPRDFGTLFHQAAEDIYRDAIDTIPTNSLGGALVSADYLQSLLDGKGARTLEQYVDHAFSVAFFGEEAQPDKAAPTPAVRLAPHPYTGLQLINRDALLMYLRRLLWLDKQWAPFTVFPPEQEQRVVHTVKALQKDQEEVSVVLGGTIDRQDDCGGTLRIVDYKTGGSMPAACEVADLFSEQRKSHAGYLLQTFYYALLRHRLQPDLQSIRPALLFIHKVKDDKSRHDPTVRMKIGGKSAPVENFLLLEEEFTEWLDHTIRRLLSPSEPWRCTREKKTNCPLCDYKQVCPAYKDA